jgi:hypothetical protein
MSRVRLLLLVSVLAAALAAPASALAAPPDHASAHRDHNPVELCGEDFVYMVTVPGLGEVPLPMATRGGCVSSYATGRVSTAGYAAQCRLLEGEVFTYPYRFYGMYLAENRADCIRILRGVHTGQLALPPQFTPPND